MGNTAPATIADPLEYLPGQHRAGEAYDRYYRPLSRRRAVYQIGCGLCGLTNDLRDLYPPYLDE